MLRNGSARDLGRDEMNRAEEAQNLAKTDPRITKFVKVISRIDTQSSKLSDLKNYLEESGKKIDNTFLLNAKNVCFTSYNELAKILAELESAALELEDLKNRF
jgi:hypothetical protein